MNEREREGKERGDRTKTSTDDDSAEGRNRFGERRSRDEGKAELGLESKHKRQFSFSALHKSRRRLIYISEYLLRSLVSKKVREETS